MAGRSTALTAIFTPGYAAAEQMTSAKQGPWTDIYGLSATLYHAITGRTPPGAFDRMLSDTYEPLSQIKPAGFSPGVLAGIDAGLAVVASDRPQTHRRLAADPRHDRGAGGRCHGRHRQGAGAGTAARLDPAAAACGVGLVQRRTGLWIALVAVVLVLLGGGGYYYAVRGPDPETVKARQAAEEAEARRLKAEEEAAKLRAENEQRLKAEAER